VHQVQAMQTKVRTVREGSFILEGQAGGVYSTAYREAIPETAKLTIKGNSQVLVLHMKFASGNTLPQKHIRHSIRGPRSKLTPGI